MAEIRIEKKKPIWPWILLGLVILAIILFFVFVDDDDDDTDDLDRTEEVQDTTFQEREQDTTRWETLTNDTLNRQDEQVSRYLIHVEDEAQMGVDHEYTNNALLRLMDAVESKARQLEVDINADMQQVRQSADRITQNPQATNHAGNIKDAGTNISNALEKIQQEKFNRLSQDVEEVKTAVEEIDPSVETLQQKDQINSFFKEAADVLRKMN